MQVYASTNASSYPESFAFASFDVSPATDTPHITVPSGYRSSEAELRSIAQQANEAPISVKTSKKASALPTGAQKGMQRFCFSVSIQATSFVFLTVSIFISAAEYALAVKILFSRAGENGIIS
ncbi:MAG: hypothetical protein II124_07790 [Clostridia bacterium]|nr:hypothetical protein [Clostridia bacterium]